MPARASADRTSPSTCRISRSARTATSRCGYYNGRLAIDLKPAGDDAAR
jgi:hypothetical protein